MAFDQLLRKRFGVVVVPPLIVVVALLNAQAVTQLVGIGLAPDDTQLAAAPPLPKTPPASTTTRATSADPILARNPFDHVTGPLRRPETTEEGTPGPSTLDTSDPWSAPACDGIKVLVIAASKDEDWSMAALAGPDNKTQLRRRGGEIAGKKVHFVGRDRVWFDNGGALCQATLFDRSVNAVSAAPVASAATPAPTSSVRFAPRLGGGLDPAIKNGIRKTGPTEFDIDRGVVDKILENQADLMRTARVAPEQENGRTVGIRLMNIKSDSLLGVLGMESGDRLQTINGFDMSSPEKALEAYARLRTADKLTVQVNRGGKNMNLDYNIK